MLKLTQKLGEPLRVGNAIIYITAKPNVSDAVCVAIDAPRSMEVMRDDVVIRELERAGFERDADYADRWIGSTGKIYSTREALALAFVS